MNILRSKSLFIDIITVDLKKASPVKKNPPLTGNTNNLPQTNYA